MAKRRVTAIVKIQLPAGKATPAPPVGTALGPHGVQTMEFVKQYNAATEDQVGQVIPVEITIFEDRSLHLHPEDAADRRPAAPGRRAGQGRPDHRPRDRRLRHRRPARPRSPRSRCRTSTPTTSRRPRPRSPARPGRWASRSADAPSARRRSAPVNDPDEAGEDLAPPVPPDEGDSDVEKGKKYVDAAKRFDRTRTYAPGEALDLVQQPGPRQLRRDRRDGGPARGSTPARPIRSSGAPSPCPSGTGKPVRVAVFAAGAAAEEARAAGADVVGADDLVARVDGGFMDFDVAIATPELMGQVGRLGRKLGPRGLMPNPKTGTVTPDVGRAVTEFKGGRVEYRADTRSRGVVQVPIGKVSFSRPQLLGELPGGDRRGPAGQAGRGQGPLHQVGGGELHHGPRSRRGLPPPCGSPTRIWSKSAEARARARARAAVDGGSRADCCGRDVLASRQCASGSPRGRCCCTWRSWSSPRDA